MPDPGPGFSRPCPSCGRRVPRSVAVCRCGAEVPALEAESAEPGTGGLSAANLVVGLLLLAGVAGTLYWTFTQSPATAPTQLASSTVNARREPPPPQPGEEISPERRAWEAELAAAAAPEPLTTAAASPAAPAAPLEDVVARIMPAVVTIETSTGRGSGFFVRADTLLTSLHVVSRETFVTLRRLDGTTASARVELRAPAFDLAILKLTSPATEQVVIPIGAAGPLRPGQEVITIGSALGTLQNSVSRGVVSGLRRSGDATLIQNDAAANPGNSGGPLLDRNGVAVGVTTGGDTKRPGINFAVAIEHARDLLEGRIPSATAPPLALANAETIMPEKADRPPDGERAFAAAIADLARNADAFDVEWKKFRQACYSGAIPASYGREWFVMLSPSPIAASQVSTGACASFITGFQPDASRLGTAIRSALANARRAGVLPGTVRDALSANRLEFDGWDR